MIDALEADPDSFHDGDMVVIRYEGPRGAPGMPEMLDPTSRITALCRQRGITIALMTDARFSGGSVGLVIGHVGPEAYLGGPIALIEDGDTIVDRPQHGPAELCRARRSSGAWGAVRRVARRGRRQRWGASGCDRRHEPGTESHAGDGATGAAWRGNGAGLTSPDQAVDGALLAGGRSSRMGRDKALVEVDGVPMAARVAATLVAAGCDRIFTIGGDARLAQLGPPVTADSYPGEGPLGGIVTALRTATADVVLVVACDMPFLDPSQVRALIDALGKASGAAVAVATAGGVLQPLVAAWRRRSLEVVERLFDGGERSPRRAIAQLDHVKVELGTGRWSTDFDTPEQLGGQGSDAESFRRDRAPRTATEVCGDGLFECGRQLAAGLVAQVESVARQSADGGDARGVDVDLGVGDRDGDRVQETGFVGRRHFATGVRRMVVVKGEGRAGDRWRRRRFVEGPLQRVPQRVRVGRRRRTNHQRLEHGAVLPRRDDRLGHVDSRVQQHAGERRQQPTPVAAGDVDMPRPGGPARGGEDADFVHGRPRLQ